MKKLCYLKISDYKKFDDTIAYLTSNDIVFSVYIRYFFMTITVYE